MMPTAEAWLDDVLADADPEDVDALLAQAVQAVGAMRSDDADPVTVDPTDGLPVDPAADPLQDGPATPDLQLVDAEPDDQPDARPDDHQDAAAGPISHLAMLVARAGNGEPNGMDKEMDSDTGQPVEAPGQDWPRR